MGQSLTRHHPITQGAVHRRQLADERGATAPQIEQLKSLLVAYPGQTEVHVKLVQPGRSVLLKLDDSFRVEANEALMGDLKVLLGARSVG